MASLKRGISFRRQGSSGLSWADSWTFSEVGIFQAKPNDAAVHHHLEPDAGPMAAEFRVGKVKMPKPDKAATTPTPDTLRRSRSLDGPRKSYWGFRWLKQKFCKSKT